MAIIVGPPCDALRSRIKMADPHIDHLADAVARHGIPPRRPGGDNSVNLPQHLRISDQARAKHRDSDHLEIHLTAGEGSTEFRQPLQELHPVVHLRGSPAPTDTQLGRHLSSHGLPVVDAPLRPVLGMNIGQPQLTQPASRQNPPRRGHPLIALGAGHFS